MWAVTISKKSEKFLGGLSLSDKNKINEFVDDLVNWPFFKFNWDIKKLKGQENTYRSRVGINRIIFIIYKKEVHIFIKDISHRKDAYKK